MLRNGGCSEISVTTADVSPSTGSTDEWPIILPGIGSSIDVFFPRRPHRQGGVHRPCHLHREELPPKLTLPRRVYSIYLQRCESLKDVCIPRKYGYLPYTYVKLNRGEHEKRAKAKDWVVWAPGRSKASCLGGRTERNI